jgi:hypothetical protein
MEETESAHDHLCDHEQMMRDNAREPQATTCAPDEQHERTTATRKQHAIDT